VIADAVSAAQVVIGGAVIAVAIFWTITVSVAVLIATAAIREGARRRRARQHDTSPDALRLLEDLDDHLDDVLANDPDVAAGFARLDAAIRREQQGEAHDA